MSMKPPFYRRYMQPGRLGLRPVAGLRPGRSGRKALLPRELVPDAAAFPLNIELLRKKGCTGSITHGVDFPVFCLSPKIPVPILTRLAPSSRATL